METIPPATVADTLAVYIPMEQRQALSRGETLPERTQGAALFADISGFTPLTEALVGTLGPHRGAEELTRALNQVYDALITDLHRFGGSVIGFSGDAITCWLEGDSGRRATACALTMQQTMARFATVMVPSSQPISLAMKAAVATGLGRRFVVGDERLYVSYAVAGSTFERLAAAESVAGKGEVVVEPAVLAALGERVKLVEKRSLPGSSTSAGVVTALAGPEAWVPWPAIPPGKLTQEMARPWLLPPVYERLVAGKGEFLAELRPVVALFLRFGGINYDKDEDAGEKLNAYVCWVQSVLAQYEGFLLQLTIGDKGSYLYAAFGAPIAHEDDVVRTISAALALQSPPAHLRFVDKVQIGVSQGQMRTGAYGGQQRRTYGALGDETNVAARLMQATVPGQIVVSSSIQKTGRRDFDWKALPPLKLKGKTGLFAVFSPRRRRALRPLLERVSDYALPMVGREEERALLQQKLELARQGEGQIVAITAEAGMGKTRLAVEAIRMAREMQFVILEGECQSYGTNIRYLPWQSVWRRFFEVDHSQDLDEQLEVLEQELATVNPALVPRLPLLGAVLNLPIADNDLTRSFDAKLRKTSLEALLVDCLRARSQEQPLLIVLEECHWLDPLSHELLEAIGRSTANVPVMLVIVHRPLTLQRLLTRRVSQLPHYSRIELMSLTQGEAEKLISLKLSQLFNAPTLLPALVARLAERAQGNPFYLEELLNYLHLRGVDPGNVEMLQQLELPSSLRSLVLSRIDQLSESQKSTLKVASVIGRLFRVALLWGTYPTLGEPAEVRADLEALLRADLVVQDTPEPELAYLFKHIITQEVAYESLPYSTRATFHEHLAQFIEQMSEGRPEQYLNLLAYHYDRTENVAKKQEYLRRAGEAAQADYANEVAIDYYRRVLPLLPAPDQVAVMLKLGDVLQLVGKWEEAEALYQDVVALAKEVGDEEAEAWGAVGSAELLSKQGRFAEAAELLDRARYHFTRLDDQDGIAQVLHSAGTMAAQQGDYPAATVLYEESLALRRELDDKPRIASLLSNLGILARYQGKLDEARRLYEESLSIRRELEDRWAIAISLNNLGNLALDQGHYGSARERLEEAVRLQREVGDRAVLAMFLNTLANVIRAQGEFPEARAMYRESLEISRVLSYKWAVAYLLEDVGVLAALQGQNMPALRLVGSAAQLRETIGAPLSPAEQQKLDEMLVGVRQLVGKDVAETVAAEGQTMSWQEATAYAVDVVLAGASGPELTIAR